MSKVLVELANTVESTPALAEVSKVLEGEPTIDCDGADAETEFCN